MDLETPAAGRRAFFVLPEDGTVAVVSCAGRGISLSSLATQGGETRVLASQWTIPWLPGFDSVHAAAYPSGDVLVAGIARGLTDTVCFVRFHRFDVRSPGEPPYRCVAAAMQFAAVFVIPAQAIGDPIYRTEQRRTAHQFFSVDFLDWDPNLQKARVLFQTLGGHNGAPALTCTEVALEHSEAWLRNSGFLEFPSGPSDIPRVRSASNWIGSGSGPRVLLDTDSVYILAMDPLRKRNTPSRGANAVVHRPLVGWRSMRGGEWQPLRIEDIFVEANFGACIDPTGQVTVVTPVTFFETGGRPYVSSTDRATSTWNVYTVATEGLDWRGRMTTASIPWSGELHHLLRPLLIWRNSAVTTCFWYSATGELLSRDFDAR